MDTSTRRKRRGVDRLGDLPDCLLHVILSYLRSRQAVQTSVLSRRWRHLFRDVPCVDIDDRDFTNGGDGRHWERFEDFSDRLLTSIRPGARLDVFRLHLASRVCDNRTSSRWIRRGLRHLPAAVDICATHDHAVSWRPHLPFPCPVGMRRWFHAPPPMLRLVGVHILTGFVEDLGRHCPTIRELHAERCYMRMDVLASPTLRRLTVVDRRHHCRTAVAPRLVAPCLASLCLEIVYDGEVHGNVARAGAATPKLLTVLTEASVRLKEVDRHRPNHQGREQRKLKFFKSMAGFIALMPNVVNLHLQGFTTMALLEKESQEFPMLYNLRSLLLEKCDVGMSFQALASILRNTPNLEKLALDLCMFAAPPIVKRWKEMASSESHCATPVAPVGCWGKKLRTVEIKRRSQDWQHMAKVLSEISKGMLPAQWRQVKTSCTIVSG
ncbi:hypothetical protein VPH35_113988 [Triticum aestivum]